MNNKIVYISLILVFIIPWSGWATVLSDSGNPSIFDAMSFQEEVPITIEGDISFLKANKRNQDEHDAILSFADKDGIIQKYDIELTIRGRYRRMFSEGVPPLRLNFKKKALKKSGFNDYDDLKLVTLFHADKKEAYQTLIKEYLAYKIYNILSEDSYRVQLVKIDFKDTSTGEVYKEHGFLIEDTAQVLGRIGAQKIEDTVSVDLEDFHPVQQEFIALFQYMIGNGDWNFNTFKNLKICRKNEYVVGIPFDFDFCGLVNASYAVPNNIYDINSVRDRIYLGQPDSMNHILSVYRLFERNKEEILEAISKCKLLNRENKNNATAYLESFFVEMEIRKKYNLTMSGSIEEYLPKK